MGVSVSGAHSSEFTKHVKVLENGQVFAQVAKVGTTSEGASVGVNAALTLPTAPAGSNAVTKQLSSQATKVEQSLEERVHVTANVGLSASQTSSLKVGGVFDLKTQQGQQAFSYLMKANPLELQANPRQAEAALQSMGTGVAYAEGTRTGGVNANVQLGQTNLLSFSSARRTTEGVLLEKHTGEGTPVEKSQLTEQEYTRTVGGALPRLLVGEERSFSFRAGSVTKNGVEAQAAVASLSLKDNKVTASDQQEFAAFATQFGATLPPAVGSGGKGTLDVQVAITDAGLQKLQARSADDIKAAFGDAKARLEGSPAPWSNTGKAAVNKHYGYAPQKTVQQEFQDARKGWEDATTFGDPDNAKPTLARDYKATTGRDLESDLQSYDAMNHIAEQLVKAQGKPVGEWGPALSAVGSQNSRDVRTTLVALHQLADAGVVSMNVDANGARLSSVTGVAPKTTAEIVGPLLTPAGVS